MYELLASRRTASASPAAHATWDNNHGRRRVLLTGGTREVPQQQRIVRPCRFRGYVVGSKNLSKPWCFSPSLSMLSPVHKRPPSSNVSAT